MRLLTILAVIVVFAALMLFDTAALVRLTMFCAGGGCGVRPLWIAAGVGVLLLLMGLTLFRPGAGGRSTKGRSAPRRPSRAKAGADRKPRKAK
jgi:hypothetical protein